MLRRRQTGKQRRPRRPQGSSESLEGPETEGHGGGCCVASPKVKKAKTEAAGPGCFGGDSMSGRLVFPGPLRGGTLSIDNWEQDNRSRHGGYGHTCQIV